MNNERIKLVTPTKEYENQVMQYRKTFMERKEHLSGCGLLEECVSYDEWLNFESRLSKKYGESFVPSEVYLAIKKSDNSRRTILANGGKLENEVKDDVGIGNSGIIQRFWINLKDEKN